MRTTPKDAEERPRSFPTSLMRQHLALLREAGDEDLPPGEEGRQRVRDFVSRTAMSGRLLDAPAERRAAQGVLDYWVASLNNAPEAAKRERWKKPGPEQTFSTPAQPNSASRQDGSVPEPAGVDESRVLKVHAESWTDQQSELDARWAARAISVRLEAVNPSDLAALAENAEGLYKRLPPTDHAPMVAMLQALLEPDDRRSEFQTVARRWSDWVVIGAAIHPGGTEAALLLAQYLVKAGIVLRSQDNEELGPTVELVSGGLVRVWPPLSQAVTARSTLRTKALLWEKRGRAEPSLFSQVRAAPDAAVPSSVLDPLERDYAKVSGGRWRTMRRLAFGVILLTLLTLAFALYMDSRASNARADAERERADALEAQRQREVAFRENVRQAITTRDLPSLLVTLREAGITVPDNILNLASPASSTSPPAPAPAALATSPDACRGAIWTGPGARYLRGAPTLDATDWAGRRLQTTAALRLRRGVPEPGRGQQEPIGVLSAGTWVVAQGNPVPDDTQGEGRPYFVPIVADGPRCVVVYVQYVGPSDRIRPLSERLEQAGYNVQDAQLLAVARGMSEVRFYYPDDKLRAEALADRVRTALGRDIQTREPARFRGKNPPPGTLELWVDLSSP